MRGCIGCLVSALFYLFLFAVLGWVVYTMAINLAGYSILGVPALVLVGIVVFIKLRG